MVLCIGHIIGEYFLTNKYIVKKKDKKKIFCYCLAYIIPFIIIGMLFYIYGYNIGKICLECICIHFIIEVIKRWIENYDIRTNKLPINVTNNFSYFKLPLNYLEIFYIGLLFSRIYNKTDSLSAVFFMYSKTSQYYIQDSFFSLSGKT